MNRSSAHLVTDEPITEPVSKNWTEADSAALYGVEDYDEFVREYATAYEPFFSDEELAAIEAEDNRRAEAAYQAHLASFDEPSEDEIEAMNASLLKVDECMLSPLESAMKRYEAELDAMPF